MTRWATLLTAFLVWISCSGGTAPGFDEQVCNENPQVLVCRVMADLGREWPLYLDWLETQPHSRVGAWDAFYLLPRLLLAGDGVTTTVEHLAETRLILPNAHEAGGVWNPHLAPDFILETENRLAFDPLLPTAIEDLAALETSDLEIAGPVAQLLVARAYAASGKPDVAEAIFQRNPGLVLWSQTLGPEGALESLSELTAPQRAYALLAIAEGLAHQSDLVGLEEVIALMPRGFPVMAMVWQAEAHRRQNEVESARRILNEAIVARDALHAGMMPKTFDIRIARALALLGELDAAIALIKPYVTHEPWTNQFKVIAPHVACHDFERALDLAVRELESPTTDQPSHTWFLTADISDVLIAAGTSDQAEDAYAFAAATDDQGDRVLYLMSVAIGLLHAFEAPDDAVPCWTLRP
jgi:tetratricopeptide (TPR) repeat protein